MDKIITPAYASVRALIYIDETPIGGQVGAQLTRTMSPIDITNKIKGEWSRSLAGTKSWSLVCNGLVIVDEAGYLAIKDAFMQGTTVKIKMVNGEEVLEGNALITSFPVDINFQKEYVYNVKFLGTGILE